MSDARDGAALRYEVAATRDIDEIAILLAETFALHDPPAVAMGITPADFIHLARAIAAHALPSGLTIITRSVANGEMLGALLTEDPASPAPLESAALSPKFSPIFAILAQLDASYRRGEPPRAGECLHLFLLGVAPAGAGHGIAQRLVAACLENGRRLSYRTAVTEATNRVSQHVFRKAGFSERVRGSYGEFRFEGKTPFRSIAAEGGPVLMDRAIA